MSDLSLRQYLEPKVGSPNQGVRSYCAPGMKTISLRSLMTSLRIIHISDLHFTNSEHTWDAGGTFGIYRDNPDNEGRQKIADFLIDNRNKFGTDIIIITGDLTDSGDDADYPIARDFIKKLETSEAKFRVYAVPGNHDYCWEGNLFFEDLFKAIKELETSMDVGNIVANILSGGVVGAVEWIVAKTQLIDKTTSLIKDTIVALLHLYLPMVELPKEYVDEISALFTVTVEGEPWNPKIRIKAIDEIDKADNNERRQRFIRYITPGDSSKYPRYVDFDNGRLILLDSMQERLDKLDGEPGGQTAQGRLGRSQLDKFEQLVSKYQQDRRNGKKLIVCLHHSPFHVKRNNKPNDNFQGDDSKCLEDFDKFFDKFYTIESGSKIDCLLFGHTTPEGVFQQPRESDTITTDRTDNFKFYESKYAPMINCENLEQVHKPDSYPITVLDLGCYQRLVFHTNGAPPTRSWGNPPVQV